MGVPGFSSWFKKAKAKNGFLPNEPATFDHVYVDLATLLHVAVNSAKTTRDIHRQLHVRLKHLVKMYQPRKTLMLALDGPAPLAKLLTQRARRLSSGRKEARTGHSGPSGLGLTPGTPLMLELEASLEAYIGRVLSEAGGNKEGLVIELSAASVPGEGEVKIVRRLAHPLGQIRSTETHAVIGSDSDLYLMALLQPEELDLYILPEQKLGKMQKSKISRDKLSTKAFDKAWSSSLPFLKSTGSAELTAERLRSVKADFVLLTILAKGNDYLPGIVELSFDRPGGLWESYLRLRSKKAFSDRGIVNMTAEGRHIDKEMLTEVLKAVKVTHARQRDEWHLLKPDASPEHYIRGLEWVLEMYTTGVCPNYRYAYDAQTPDLSGLKEFLGRKDTSASQESEEKGPLSPAVCSMALLPASGGERHALPALKPLMMSSSPIADVFEVCRLCAEYSAESQSISQKIARERLRLKARLLKDPEVSSSDSSELDSVDEPEIIEETAPSNSRSELQRLQRQLRVLTNKRLTHYREVHPYSPFPVQRVTEAVAAIPADHFTASERALLSFGQPALYWNTSQGNTAISAAAGEEGAEKFKPPELPYSWSKPLPGNSASYLQKMRISDIGEWSPDAKPSKSIKTELKPKSSPTNRAKRAKTESQPARSQSSKAAKQIEFQESQQSQAEAHILPSTLLRGSSRSSIQSQAQRSGGISGLAFVHQRGYSSAAALQDRLQSRWRSDASIHRDWPTSQSSMLRAAFRPLQSSGQQRNLTVLTAARSQASSLQHSGSRSKSIQRLQTPAYRGLLLECSRKLVSRAKFFL